MGRKKKGGPAISLFAFQDIITSVTGIMLLVTMMLALELVRRKAKAAPVQTERTSQSLDEAVAANQRAIQSLEQDLAKDLPLPEFDDATMRRKIEELKRTNAIAAQQAAEMDRRRSAVEEMQDQVADSAVSAPTPEQVAANRERLTTAERELEELRRSNRIIFNRPVGESKSPWIIEVDSSGLRVAEVGVAAPPQSFTDPSELADWASGKAVGAVYFVILLKPSGIPLFDPLKQDLESLRFEIGYDLIDESQQAISPETGAGTSGSQRQAQ